MNTIEIKKVLLKRGNTAQSMAYTGLLGEVTIDTDLNCLRIHNGVTPGGEIVASTSTTIQGVVNDAIAALLDGAPEALNTLKELADALADNSDSVTDILTTLASKANTADLTDVATSGSYNDLTDTPTIPADISDLTDTTNLLGGADTGDITFTDATISAADDTIIAIEALDGDSKLRSRLSLDPDLGAISMRGYSAEDDRIYLANDWGTATWTSTGFGSGQITITDAAAIYNFIDVDLSNATEVTFSINGGAAQSLSGWSYSSIPQTLNIGTESVPDPDPTTVTEIRFFYAFSSRIGIDYDDEVVSMTARGDMNISLTSDVDINLTAGDDVRIEGADSFRLINTSVTDPIRIITDDTNNSYTWAFNADGTLTFPDATVQTTAYTGPQTTLDGDVTGSVFADDSTLLVDGVNAVVPTSESAKSVTQVIDSNTAVTTSENLTTDNIFVNPFDFVADLDPDLGFVIAGLGQRNETEIEVNLFVAGGEFFQTYLLGLALDQTVIVTYSTVSGNQTFTSTISQAFTSIGQFDPSTGWARTSGRILGTVPEGYTGLVEINFPEYSIQSHVWQFGSNGDLEAPGDITTGTNDGRFIQDCGDGTTSIRWINVNEGSDSTQLIRAYTGDPKLDTEVERAQIKLNWAGEFDEQSGLTIRSFDQNTNNEYDWDFRGDGDLSLPDDGELAFNDIVGPAGRIIPSVSDGGGLTVQAETDLEIKVNDGEGGSSIWSFESNGGITFPDNTAQTTAYTGDYNDLSNKPTIPTAVSDLTNDTGYINKNIGSWTVTPGTNSYSFTVDWNNTYVMWVRANIPNGIIVWNATVSVTNANVPIIGQQFAWNYTGGGSPILLTSIPNQIVGTSGIISTDDLAVTDSNTFVFGISNNSGLTQTVEYGYAKVS